MTERDNDSSLPVDGIKPDGWRSRSDVHAYLESFWLPREALDSLARTFDLWHERSERRHAEGERAATERIAERLASSVSLRAAVRAQLVHAGDTITVDGVLRLAAVCVKASSVLEGEFQTCAECGGNGRHLGFGAADTCSLECGGSDHA